MTAEILILSTLVATSAIVAIMLNVAWHDLGRPRHARTWAIAFALSALMWTLPLLHRVALVPLTLLSDLMAGISGLSAALIAIGFRQRGGLTAWKRPLLAAAAIHFCLLVALRWSESGISWVLPMSAFSATMYLIAARTLRGRRSSERAAERVAEAGLALLTGLNLLVLAGAIGLATGVLAVRLDPLLSVTMTLMPATVAIIGLFTIILLTADLADQTRRLASTDMLTDVLNRRGFEAAAGTFLDAARRRGRQASLALIDLDRFKEVNDRFGHPAGDRVLRHVCRRIAQGIGRRDIFARLGGEEFALIMSDADAATALCAVEVLRAQVEALVLDLPERVHVTASFGIAEARGNEPLAELCARADRALYRAKAEGRNRVIMAE